MPINPLFVRDSRSDPGRWIDEVLARLSTGPVHSPERDIGAVDRYLAVWTTCIGHEFFGRVDPGDVDPEFTARFYQKVLADSRCVRAIQRFQSDLEEIASAEDLVAVAARLRTRARRDADEFLVEFSGR